MACPCAHAGKGWISKRFTKSAYGKPSGFGRSNSHSVKVHLSSIDYY
jgi:hypothetical protein